MIISWAKIQTIIQITKHFLVLFAHITFFSYICRKITRL